MIKHIFSDMDGTLLNDFGQVSPVTVEAVKTAQIPLTLVSARAPLEMQDAIRALGLTEPQIAFNGGLIYLPQEHGITALSECPIDLTTVQLIVRKIQELFPKVSLSLYNREQWLAEENDDGTVFESSLTNQYPSLMPFSKVFDKSSTPLFKVMLITFDTTEMSKLKEFFEKLSLPDVNIQQSDDTHLEITSIDAKKSRGIDYIFGCEKLNIDETACFGDGFNDLAMFDRVSYKIAMGNAFPEIKAKATYITKSNIEDGIAYALRSIPIFKN